MTVTAAIDIDAPPHVVREVFLDFPKLRDWHSGTFFQFIEVETPGKTTGMDVVAGDVLKTRIPGMTFRPVVVANTPECFQWLGSIPLLLYGRHDFIFGVHPSGGPNKTAFKQEENFTGLLGFLSAFGNGPSAGWHKVNQDLKVEAERVWRERK